MHFNILPKKDIASLTEAKKNIELINQSDWDMEYLATNGARQESFKRSASMFNVV
jgi:hypothetical protein